MIFLQAIEQLKPHMNSRVIQSEGDMEDIYTLIPFPDKERYQFKRQCHVFLELATVF